MSKRSPFWQSFSETTPLGYAIAGQFNTEPGPAYGAIRFTHVDGPLPRAYILPGMPVAPRLALGASDAAVPIGANAIDVRAVERLDGTLIGFYPLFNAESALVEVVPRTQDSVVVADTPWRPLAALVTSVRHAGIEEAVRRQRAMFVFALVGSNNARLVRYPFPPRLVLHCVPRGQGRALATYSQARSWANHYGLDLPATRRELAAEGLAAQLLAMLREMAPQATLPPGEWSDSGLALWASGRAGATLLDLPVCTPFSEQSGISPIDIYEAMARLADRGLTPTRDRTAAALALTRPAADIASLAPLIEPAWDRWARAYPGAFPATADHRVAG